MVPRPDVDVIVVGGGPAGAALALALSRLGRRSLVVEKAAEPRDKPCGEGLMPLGADLLSDLGLELGCLGYPAVEGVRFRLADGRGAAGRFASGRGLGYGVRRLRFNADLLEATGRAPRVGLEMGCRALRPVSGPGWVGVETDRGRLVAGALVAADGLGSSMSRQLGWSRPPRPPHRYGLVSHLEAPGHSQREICVTLLPGKEVYSAPAGVGQVLAAVLGPRGRLVEPGVRVEAAYREAVEIAHPELASAAVGQLRGAGPFRRRPSTVAGGRTFLLGDAAGFIDPLTGDAMAAGIAAAIELARLLAADPDSAAPAYRAWNARQWRRRRLLTALALFLTGGSRRAARALSGISRRPAALDSLLEVNGGRRELRQVAIRDWVSLAGI